MNDFNNILKSSGLGKLSSLRVRKAIDQVQYEKLYKMLTSQDKEISNLGRQMVTDIYKTKKRKMYKHARL